MKISERKIKRAKKILAKAEELEKQKETVHQAEQEKRREEYKKRRAILSTYRDRLVSEIVSEFELENEPRFEIGESVIINLYAKPNGWEGTLRQYLRGCNKDIGVSIVKIIERYIDKSYLYGVLEKMEQKQYEILNGLSEKQYHLYKNVWNKYTPSSSIPLVGYSYMVETRDGENLTEKYGGFREPNFVKLGTELEKLVVEAYKLEEKENEISKQHTELKKKSYQLHRRRNQMAKEYPNLGLVYICNLPKSEKEFLEKGWR